MVFVGSRVKLQYIGAEFKDVWVNFINEFNKSFPRRIKIRELKKNIDSMRKKVKILKNEVVKKVDDLNHKYEGFRHNLAALIGSLQTLEQDLNEFMDALPVVDSVRKKEIVHSITALLVQIKQVKASIALAAESYIKESRRKALLSGANATIQSVIILTGTSLYTFGLTPALSLGLKTLAKKLPSKKKDGLSILISYNTSGISDAWLKKNSELFLPLYISRVELAFGQKANAVYKAATSKDLFKKKKPM